MATKAQKTEQQDAIDKLRAIVKPGDTVYTILDHVSSSGMSRHIRVVVLSCEDGKSVDLHPNWLVGKALGMRHARRNGREQDALLVGGCGMDMGFHVVYELSYALYGNGYPCLGKGKCPSNYHVNHRNQIRCEGTRVYNPDGPDTGTYCFPSEGDKRPYVIVRDGEYVVCPTCKGQGYLPNPEGPERFDLVHTDGYALKHRWL